MTDTAPATISGAPGSGSQGRGSQGGAIVRPLADIDAGLRTYMQTVYLYMMTGIALTGIVAYGLHVLAVTDKLVPGGQALSRDLFLTPLGASIYLGPWMAVMAFAPIAFVLLGGLYVWMRGARLSVGAAQVLFWTFAVLVGLSTSVIFLVYSGQSIARVFFMASALFGALSLWGYTTKKDLSGWGVFLFMGLTALILASLVHGVVAIATKQAFPALQFAMTVGSLLLFSAFTAFDTQMIKATYFEVASDPDMAAKYAILGAFELYTDFINIMLNLLRLFGDSE
jgi:uncharacterized protein